MVTGMPTCASMKHPKCASAWNSAMLNISFSLKAKENSWQRNLRPTRKSFKPNRVNGSIRINFMTKSLQPWPLLARKSNNLAKNFLSPFAKPVSRPNAKQRPNENLKKRQEKQNEKLAKKPNVKPEKKPNAKRKQRPNAKPNKKRQNARQKQKP